MASDLLLDPQIRLWVVVPIAVIAFCIGLCRQYVMLLIRNARPHADLDKLREEQLLQRSRLLRSNGRFLPPQAFLRRKAYFNDSKKGILSRAKELYSGAAAPSPLEALSGGGNSDPNAMTDMLKMQVINMVPMVVIGGIINYVFSGFVIIQVPFPLTVAFKPMLQRGIELSTLSASWVSSMSFYFACTFGLSSLGMLFSADPTATPDYNAMMMMPMMPQQQGPKKPGEAFEHEWDALEVVRHDWALNQDEEGADIPLVVNELASVEKSLLQKWQTV